MTEEITHTEAFAEWVSEGIRTSKEFEWWLRATIAQTLMKEIQETNDQTKRGWFAEIADLNMYANIFPEEEDK